MCVSVCVPIYMCECMYILVCVSICIGKRVQVCDGRQYSPGTKWVDLGVKPF